MSSMNSPTMERARDRARTSLNRFVPPVIRTFWERTVSPVVHRVIVDSASSVRAYVHPNSHLGRTLIATGRYEIETEEILRAELQRGDIFLDIGANEGFLSALAARIVGSEGLVVAVEPQSRLQALIEINLRLNDAQQYRILHRAISDTAGSARINLYPETNNGQSSLMKRPQFGWTTLRVEQEDVSFITPQEILLTCSIDHFDLVKVDVEGFEHKVVDALLPLIGSGKVRKLLLDYHSAILSTFGIDPKDIHQKLLRAGMRIKRGDPRHLNSYLLYDHGSP